MGSTRAGLDPLKHRRRSCDDRLTVDECRRLLGVSCPGSDEEVIKLRDQVYDFAHVIVSLRSSRVVQEDVDERAAIMEVDGKVPETTARRKAFTLVSKGRR